MIQKLSPSTYLQNKWYILTPEQVGARAPSAHFKIRYTLPLNVLSRSLTPL